MQPDQFNTLYPYLLVIVPEEPLASSLLAIKKTIEKFIDQTVFQQPHITVFPMFYWCDKQEYLLVHHIKNILPHLYSFEVNIKGIACNQDKKQLFMPTDSNNLFDACHIHFKDYFSFHTSEHQLSMNDINGQLILANGDLKKNALVKAWNKIKHVDFEGSFYANKIALLKRDLTGWNVIKHFHLD